MKNCTVLAQERAHNNPSQPLTEGVTNRRKGGLTSCPDCQRIVLSLIFFIGRRKQQGHLTTLLSELNEYLLHINTCYLSFSSAFSQAYKKKGRSPSPTCLLPGFAPLSCGCLSGFLPLGFVCLNCPRQILDLQKLGSVMMTRCAAYKWKIWYQHPSLLICR